ncbi:type VI secretion system baseplate subunit TssE [[Erwinia] mediterraneensis]|uniref:type VI secretion system baseplate subunit TssE n=1 Tax=[Erwinia] mediterraneensis TaxID=2161819 RepID=UPI0010314232|nr:GPW/gp25 family protein [[Erwinia] mediterraneensis]
MEAKKPFLPTLLDRLIDEEPKLQEERFDRFFYSGREMRAIVLRDLIALLNNANLEDQLDPVRHQHVTASVLNYGIAPMTGSYAIQHNWTTIEKIFREAILRFEPRIIPESLRVTAPGNLDTPFQNGMMLFEIHALIYWQPYPIDLAAKGIYDRENDRVMLNDS